MISRAVESNNNLRSYGPGPVKKLKRLPKEGNCIVFNEKCKYHTRSGRDYWPMRGICEVIETNGQHVVVKLYKNSRYQYITSLNATDFRIGLIKYRLLDKSVLAMADNFTYKDLNLEKLHPVLYAKVIGNETEDGVVILGKYI